MLTFLQPISIKPRRKPKRQAAKKLTQKIPPARQTGCGLAGAACVSSVAGGGKCGSGATAAVFGKWATNATANWGVGVAQGAAAVVAGGVGSVIAGGKFQNGAVTAAYGYLFNQLSRGLPRTTPCMMCGAATTRGGIYDDMPIDGERSIGQRIYDGLRSFGQAVSNVFTTQESAQPSEKDLIKLPERDGNKAAQEADFKDEHDAKNGRGGGGVDIYNDKKTGDKWLWDGRPGGEKERL